MAYGEELNLALTDYLVGRADEAYSILRATLCGIYNGPTPGGLSCHSYSDGRQRANDEFTDAISMWGRAVTEGLFGILPKRLNGVVELVPQFPGNWDNAEIKTPHFSYRWQRKGGTIEIDWNSPVETALGLHLPVRAQRIDSIRVDGKRAAGQVTPGFDGLSWVQVRAPAARAGRIVVNYTPRDIRTPGEFSVRVGDTLNVKLPGLQVADWCDPQGVLTNAQPTHGGLEALVAGEPGQALTYVLAGMPPCATWLPVKFHIEPKSPAPPPVKWKAPQAGDHDLSRWSLVDLSGTFNESVTNVLPRMTRTAKPPPPPASQVGFGYWRDHLLQYHGSRNEAISDNAWRNKVGPDGTAWTTDGIPFQTSKTGPNIGMVSLAGDFPAQLDFPVKAAGQTLYLMIGGMTFPAQSHVVNLRVTLRYADGQTQSVDLVNPFGIGDCWSTWCGRFHDTAANGFENIGGRTGPAGSSQVADLTQPVTLDTEAHLVAFPLRGGIKLHGVTLEAIANDCLFGIMGATVLK